MGLPSHRRRCRLPRHPCSSAGGSGAAQTRRPRNVLFTCGCGKISAYPCCLPCAWLREGGHWLGPRARREPLRALVCRPPACPSLVGLVQQLSASPLAPACPVLPHLHRAQPPSRAPRPAAASPQLPALARARCRPRRRRRCRRACSACRHAVASLRSSRRPPPAAAAAAPAARCVCLALLHACRAPRCATALRCAVPSAPTPPAQRFGAGAPPPSLPVRSRLPAASSPRRKSCWRACQPPVSGAAASLACPPCAASGL